MPEKLTEKAILLCNKGAKPSKLIVTSQNFCMIENKLIATEKDKEAESNIQNFGSCAITKGKCVPSVLKWDNPAEINNINNYKILTDSSICQCTVGGKIVVQNKGYTESHEIN